jgi:hypothetical protein
MMRGLKLNYAHTLKIDIDGTLGITENRDSIINDTELICLNLINIIHNNVEILMTLEKIIR